MNQTKFTPGPWRIGTPPPNGEQTIGTVAGLMVAVATTGHNVAEETKANAHLIAASPDLYEALDALKAELFLHAEGNYFRPLLDKAEIALAKARGEG